MEGWIEGWMEGWMKGWIKRGIGRRIKKNREFRTKCRHVKNKKWMNGNNERKKLGGKKRSGGKKDSF